MHSFVAALKPLNRAGRPLTSRVRGRSLPPNQERRASRALLVCLLFLAGCSEDGNNVAGPTTTATAAPRPSPTTAPAQDPLTADIVGRYKRFWEARFDANQPPADPDAAALREYATGQQLDQVVNEARNNLENALALRRPNEAPGRSSVELITVDGDQAIVRECVVDDEVVYRHTTGEVVNAAVETNSVEATMRRVGGVWKLETTRLLQRWEGVAGCALSSDF